MQFLLSVEDGYPDEASRGPSQQEPVKMATNQDQSVNEVENTGRSLLRKPSEMDIGQDRGSKLSKFE